MSPLSLGSLIGAIIFTVTKLSLVIAETAAHRPVISISVGGCVTIGAIVSWTGFFAAYCRDTGLTMTKRHPSGLRDSVNAYIETVVDERFDQFSTELHLANRTRAKRSAEVDFSVPTPPPRRPHLVP